MTFGAWNVRTLLDRDASSRPERRTALIVRELGIYQIDIAALSETRLAEESSIAEPKGGYTFFWRGKAKDGDRIHGVGLAIKISLCRPLPDLPTPVSELLMKLRFPLNPSRHVTVISAYAPTLASSDEAKDAFYGELNALVKDAPPLSPPPLPPTHPKRQVHPAGRLQCESGYRLQQLERRTRISWHRKAELKRPHVVEFMC